MTDLDPVAERRARRRARVAVSGRPGTSAASRLAAAARIEVGTARRLLAYALGRIHYPVLLIPWVLAAVVARLVTVGVLPGREMLDPLEHAALVILGLALLVSAVRWRRSRETYLAWLTCLIAAFTFREIHLHGTGRLFYVILLLLVRYAVTRSPRMVDYFSSRTVVTLFAFVIWTYMLTEALDSHLFAFIPHERRFERPTEELIELVGHTGVLLLALCSRKTDDEALSQELRRSLDVD